jgi:hypothetical protein
MHLKITISCLLVMLLLTACSAPETATPTMPAPTETAVSDSPDIQFQTLENGTYKTEMLPAGSVTLAGGAYEERIAPGATGLMKTELADEYAVGDLNQDNIQDGAVILRTDSGGSGRFYELSVVFGQDSKLSPAASLLLGDRLQIQSIIIADQKIIIKMITQGPDDPMCCPTLEATRTFQWQAGQLVEIP